MYSKVDFESELESRLNEFYHQKIVPLEKEIVKLGGSNTPDNLQVLCRICNSSKGDSIPDDY